VLRHCSRGRLGLLAVLSAMAIATTLHGQRRGFGLSARMATDDDYDGRFQFCRVWFQSGFNGDPGAGGWSADWPRADINLSIRLSELTKTTIGRLPSGQPHNVVIRLTSPELFNCPFIMMTEVGASELNSREVTHLREYLLKGGFLWVDDFWGNEAWEWWERQLRKVLPAVDYPIVDLRPDHPLYRSQFVVKQTPQISNIGFWARNGGGTSERYEESAVVDTRAILDSHGNIMLLMTHNTDLGDSFEREGDDPEYFSRMSVPGYAFGINALLYAMTH
jgi:uncharacterized protein DUF4159